MKNLEVTFNELSTLATVIPLNKRHKQMIASKTYQGHMNLLEAIRDELTANGQLKDTDVDSVISEQKREIYAGSDVTPFKATAPVA